MEYRHFYAIRQEWLASPEHAKSAAARTVMLNNVPEKFLSESAIADLAARAIKGPVEQVWLVRQVDRMNEIFEERAQECLRLEAAEGDIQALEYKLRKKGKTPPADSAEDGTLISKFIPAKDHPTDRVGLSLISCGITIAVIIFWGPIVAFVGLISNINTLANTVSFLGWINSIPTAVQGIIQGILPPVALAVLFIVLPIFLRACIQLQGEPLQSEIERQLWARFWVFQVVHGFLIITIASGLPSALQNIQARVNQLP